MIAKLLIFSPSINSYFILCEELKGGLLITLVLTLAIFRGGQLLVLC